MRLASRLAAVGLVGLALVASGCGKTGGVANLPPRSGHYRLVDGATFLALRDDGSYVVHRRSDPSIGSTGCGNWKQDLVSPSGHVERRPDDYWPSPERFPSTVLERVTLHGAQGGDLLVIGESAWAGTFSQEWTRTAAFTPPPCTPR